MRKSILFVLMVMVLFVVSVMPMAAHEGEDQGWHHAPALSMPQCRDYDTMRMWWHTGDGGDDPAPVGWGLTRWSRTWVASSYGYDVPMAAGQWTRCLPLDGRGPVSTGILTTPLSCNWKRWTCIRTSSTGMPWSLLTEREP